MPGRQPASRQAGAARQSCGTDDLDADEGEHAEQGNAERQRHSQVELDVMPAPKIITYSVNDPGSSRFRPLRCALLVTVTLRERRHGAILAQAVREDLC